VRDSDLSIGGTMWIIEKVQEVFDESSHGYISLMGQVSEPLYVNSVRHFMALPREQAKCHMGAVRSPGQYK